MTLEEFVDVQIIPLPIEIYDSEDTFIGELDGKNSIPMYFLACEIQAIRISRITGNLVIILNCWLDRFADGSYTPEVEALAWEAGYDPDDYWTNYIEPGYNSGTIPY